MYAISDIIKGSHIAPVTLGLGLNELTPFLGLVVSQRFYFLSEK